MQVNDDFNIPGLRDVAVREYSAWHEANVADDCLKAQFREKGGVLETYNDVPGEIQDELYMEKQQRQERQKRKGGIVIFEMSLISN